MSKDTCPICFGSKTEMKSVNNKLVYVQCNTCDENGEVEDSIFEDYEEDII